MEKLFPIIRRVRRPLLPADEPRSCSDAESVVPTPIEAPQLKDQHVEPIEKPIGDASAE
jgi:hypothetical protein